MRKDIVRLWGEFNYALDNFFPKRFKLIFYITMLLPYSTYAITKILYILYPVELTQFMYPVGISYILDLELFSLNALWVFFIISYVLSERIKNEWQTKTK